MVYQYKTGCKHVVPVDVVMEEFSKLPEVTAKNVVDIARAEDAPLHREFEWDDSIAGERWREEQARTLIRHIVIVQEEKPQTEPVRAFCHLTVESSVYTPTEVILRSASMTEQMLDQAKRELKAFRRKYSGLQALAKIFADIDDLTA